MKGLLIYLRRYRKESILAPLFKLFEVIFELLVPVVVARIIDVGVANGDSAYIIRAFLLLLLMAAIGLGCSVTAQFFAAKASVGFAAELRQSLFDHIQGLSFTELDKLGTDTLITRLSTDVNQVQNGLNMFLRLVLRSPFVVFGAMVMAFLLNARCALVFALAIPVLFAVIFTIMRISVPLFGRVQGGLDRVTALTRENLTGVRVIRAFRRERQSVEEFDACNRELTRLNQFVGRISALLNPLTYVLINAAAVLLIQKAAVQVNLGTMQQGQVVALYNYMLQITVELIKLASLIITLNKSVACAKRLRGVLDTRSSMAYPEEAAPAGQADGTAGAVCFRHVSFTYQGAGAPSLRDVSFLAQKGQTIGIIGGTGSGKSTLVNLIARFYDASTGSGKSTLVNLIARFYDASTGSVLVDGQDVKTYPRQALGSRVGIVQQKTVLFQGSIRDNLKLGNAAASDECLWQALTAAQAREIVENKPGGLDFMLEQNGRNLSGGQRQRLSIARTLVSQPEILILDDSSSALDFATDAALRRALQQLHGRVTTFLVSQRVAGIRQADQILVLDGGALAGCGSHDALMESCSVYQEIYYSQFPEARPASAKGGAEA